MSQITANTSVAEIVKLCPGARRIFDEHGLKGCGGEHGPSEPLGFFAAVHQANLDELLREINAEMENPSAQPYVYKESLQDYIYRRFFKAGVAIVLTVGCLWGAINLLQIGLGKNFLQLHLLSSIHAHAHAMIFGWVGMFVMGFAYQSFPRFKNTTLWRPGLANLSFYLLGTGIVAGMAAEMLLPTPVSFVLGAFSGAVEIAAVALFMLVLYRTARQSIEPHNPYEKFIASSFVWFLLGTILEAVFFFAKATAHSEHGLIMRIALIDGPLRDIQLLGFAALIIAGVSQRFVPHVYGLGKPVHDRQTLIFWLINGSLLLNIISYVLLLTTHKFYFAIRPRIGLSAHAAVGRVAGRADWGVPEADAAGPHLQVRSCRLRLVGDRLRHDAVLSTLRSSYPSGFRAHVHGFSSARLHRGLHQHDDPGSLFARCAHPGGNTTRSK